MSEIKFPSECVDLPSGGRLYPSDSPLHSGKVEMFYMTAKHEDILTNQNFIERGVVIDKLLQELIVDKSIPYDQLLIGDKNALLIAARIMGYGEQYTFDYNGRKETVNLAELCNKPLHEDILAATENCFTFELPASGRTVTFKLLTHGDEQKIEQELKGLSKIQKDVSADLSTRIKYTILSVDGNSDRAYIRSFVDKELLARDSRALRQYIVKIQPDIDLKFFPEDGPEEGVPMPMTAQFLWPDIAD